MKNWLKRRFALSDTGANSVIIGSIETALQNISFMMPVGLLILLIKDLMNNTFGNHMPIYIGGSIGCLVFIYIIAHFQYNGTYLATYEETGKRRIKLAEKLRLIPLSYFSKKDLADLTTSIMNDCDILEKSQSHFVPPLFGSMISTTIITIMLFAVNVKLSLSMLWVLPISFLIIIFSSKVQNNLSGKTSKSRVAYESGIQECIEVSNDLHTNNAEEDYLVTLENKIKGFEKNSVWAEFGKATFITASSLVLRKHGLKEANALN